MKTIPLGAKETLTPRISGVSRLWKTRSMTEAKRSLWGWGYADRFPDLDGLRAQQEMMSAVLGFPLRPPVRPPRVEDVELPNPRVSAPSELLPFSRADDEARLIHAQGKSYRDLVRGLAGRFEHPPDLVVSPRSEEEVERTLAWADREDVAVVPFGGGTSVVGGVECPLPPGKRGVLTLELSGLSRLLELDPVSEVARVQAGATGPGFEAQLHSTGFTFRHYPQSYAHSTVGGWIATRAGGHFATLHTRIDAFVQSTRMLTPAGWYESPRFPSSGAGPNPDASLVLGSEGAFGVITEAWLRVQRPPTFRARASLEFGSFHQAAQAVRSIVQAGLHPANCRVLDPVEARLNQVSQSGDAVLLLGFESADHPMNARMDRAVELAQAVGGRLVGEVKSASGGAPENTDRWKQAFIEAPYLQNVLVSSGVIADTFETACVWSRFAELDLGIRERVGEVLREVCGGGILTGRITHAYSDGVAPYYTFLAPGRAGAELEQWTAIKEAASSALLALGGTITHHHAVGRTHRPQYLKERPAVYGEAFRAMKARLDPKGLLNPGVLDSL